MTIHVRQAVEIIIKSLTTPKRVLEIGSRHESNQKKIANLRSLFDNRSEYIGVDMRKGTGVDRVINGEKLPFKNNSFDLILCLETLEHAEKPWVIAKEIERVLSKKGAMIVSSHQNMYIHKHPSDYFRFTPYGLSSLFKETKEKLVFSISVPFEDEVKLNPHAVMLLGWKTKTKARLKLKKILKQNQGKISVNKPYRHRLRDGLKILRRGLQEATFKQVIEFF